MDATILKPIILQFFYILGEVKFWVVSKITSAFFFICFFNLTQEHILQLKSSKISPTSNLGLLIQFLI